MRFEKLPDHRPSDTPRPFGHIQSWDKYYNFKDDFHLTGVAWNQPANISADYFLRLLSDGAFVREREYVNNFNTRDDSAFELYDFYTMLLDHGALWKQENGNVIFTAMPYAFDWMARDTFHEFVKRFGYPETLKMEFLDDRYRFRPNGDLMLMIYCDPSRFGLLRD